MKIADLASLVAEVEKEFGNIDVFIRSDLDEGTDYALNIPILELTEIPVDRFARKHRLIIALVPGEPYRFPADIRILDEAKPKPRLLRLVRNDA